MIRSAVAIVIVAGLAYLTQIMTTLGAHPFWATQVLLVGALIGLGLSLVPLMQRIPKSALCAVLAAAFYALATYGKNQFAASYAEDALAGQLWYFGWFGVSAMFFAAIGSMLKN